MEFLRQMTLKTFKVFFRSINILVPKNKRFICIHSTPDFDDMTRALLEQSNSINNINKFIILLDNEAISIPLWAQSSIVIVTKKKSIKGIYYYFRSAYIFFTGGCFSSVKTVDKQICVNLWHGMPIKTIGTYMKPNTYIPNCDYIIATSKFFAKIMGQAFQVPDSKVLTVGLPRNDVLLNNTAPDIKNELSHGLLLVWLPTYRKLNLKGILQEDGITEHNIFNLPDLAPESFNKELKKHNITLFVKAHPYSLQPFQTQPELVEKSNIKLIDEKWLLSKNLTLYQLLSMADGLVTDISSVLIDFLLLNKPIICCFPDKDEYINTRGFIWDFKPEEYGIPVIKSQKDFLNILQTGFLKNEPNAGLKKLREQSHEVEGHFAKKLFNVLNIN